MAGSAHIIRANALALPLADESVDLIVTSPPYWAQRSYRDAGEHYEGQVGSEPHPRLWLEAMFEVMKECWRVLKPEGSCFINLGDKRAGSGGHNNSGISSKSTLQGNGHTGGVGKAGPNKIKATLRNAPDRYEQAHFGRVKSRQGIPERFLIGCIDGLADPERVGWIWRSPLFVGDDDWGSPRLWQKANGLPESVTDRTRDDWEHVFHLTKQPRYYSAVDEIREPHAPSSVQRYSTSDGAWVSDHEGAFLDHSEDDVAGRHNKRHPGGNSLGKLPGSVWRIASEPLLIPDWAREKYQLPDHFACVDDQTEILTDRGWIRHDQLEVGNTVAGYDLDAGLARWTTCHAVHRYPFDGDLVAIEKRDLSMRLTPNHRCLASRAVWPTNHRGPLGIVDAEALTPKHFVPRSAEWESFGEKSIGEDMAALCGWVAAEGYYQDDLVRLCQSLTANPEKVRAIDALLGRFPYHLADRGGRSTYRPALGFLKRTERERVYKGVPWTEVVWRLPLWLAREVQVLMPDKRIGLWVLQLPECERRALLDAFIDGDGHRRPDGRIGIFQADPRNLDILQAVAVTLGYKTTLRQGFDKWVLYLTAGGRSITLRGTNGASVPIPREHYRGIVWCPTTGTGTFIARRNGSVFITGNSFPQEIPRRIILGWSPPAICTACGEGRRPIVEKRFVHQPDVSEARNAFRSKVPPEGGWNGTVGLPRGSSESTILGYACACPGPTAPTRPSVVLDPFAGTGTVPGVAKMLGRKGIGVDLSWDYCRLARWRIEESGHFAKAEQRTWAAAQGTLI